MIVIVMGVAGSGKTTVGELVALALGWEFRDADDYHPPANVAKMRSGIALTDADRLPWLDRLNELARERAAAGASMVLACSALKEAYRQRLAAGLAQVRFVFLRGARELIAARLATRSGHFMPPGLLDSQLATLEEPVGALVINIDRPPLELAGLIVGKLKRGEG